MAFTRLDSVVFPVYLIVIVVVGLWVSRNRKKRGKTANGIDTSMFRTNRVFNTAAVVPGRLSARGKRQ